MRDRDVRSAVKNHLNRLHAGDPDTRIVEEMGLWSGSVRIDIAVINGEFCGFELKSDRDTLNRLPSQADIYSRIFDRVELVVGYRHAIKADPIVPEWWGITHAVAQSGVVTLHKHRAGNVNPAREPYLIAQLLWKDEAVAVLESLGLASGWRSKSVRRIHERLAEELPPDTLRQQVRSMLKIRSGWLGQPVSDKFKVTIDSDLNPSL